MAKFGKTGSISIFVETNQGGGDRTVVTKMQLLGQPLVCGFHSVHG
jgi:hypothetical protein